jgi:hypothetical protein
VSILREWPPHDIFALWHAIMTLQRCSNKQGTHKCIPLLKDTGYSWTERYSGNSLWIWKNSLLAEGNHDFRLALYLFWDHDFNKEGASQHSLLGLTSISVFLFILLPWLDFHSVIYILYHTVGDSLNDLKSESSWLHIFHVIWECKCSVG